MPVVDVAATLIPRRPNPKLGIAPLTSMFFIGENDRRFAEDYRPEVHDSDGLAAVTGILFPFLTDPKGLRRDYAMSLHKEISFETEICEHLNYGRNAFTTRCSPALAHLKTIW